MKRLALIVGSVLLLASLAAVAQDVQTEYDRGYQLTQLRTFRFATQDRDAKDALAADPIVEKRIADALTKELTSAGLQTSEEPQFWIAYYGAVKERMDIRSTGWGRPYWGMSNIETTHYVEGTLVVDFIDAKTKQPVWRGTVTDTLEPNRKHDKLEKAVAKLIRKFQTDVQKQQGKK